MNLSQIRIELLFSENECAKRLGIDFLTVRKYRERNIIKPVLFKPRSFVIYDAKELCETLIEQGKSDVVRHGATRWLNELEEAV